MAAACVFFSLPILIYLTLYLLTFSYEILNDPNTREVYDNRGMAGLGGPGGAGPGMTADDLFAQFFGATGGPSFGFDFGPGGGGPSQRRKGQNEVVPYDVTLEDLYNGKTVRINMEKDVTCGVCQGSVFRKTFWRFNLIIATELGHEDMPSRNPVRRVRGRAGHTLRPRQVGQEINRVLGLLT